MGGEALGLGKGDCCRADLVEGRIVERDPSRSFEEIVNRQIGRAHV